jgi:hypothetical protein
MGTSTTAEQTTIHLIDGDGKNHLNLNLADFTDGLSSDETEEFVGLFTAHLAKAGIPVTFTSIDQLVGGDA